MKRVLVSGGFDDLRFQDFRFLDEASRLGAVHAHLWSDAVFRDVTGNDPKFPLAEREYLLRSIRYVSSIEIGTNADMLPRTDHVKDTLLVLSESSSTQLMLDLASSVGLAVQVVRDEVLIPPPAPPIPRNPQSVGKKVVVTGCFDWFHSGHVRFFEECAELGDLYVIVGHDANIRLLKGDGHPLFPAIQRRYMAGAIGFVKQALISSGDGWMDAEPEFTKIIPDIYAVNEDGDKPEKREFCRKHGIEYKVLKRAPREGLPRRQSTALRGF